MSVLTFFLYVTCKLRTALSVRVGAYPRIGSYPKVDFQSRVDFHRQKPIETQEKDLPSSVWAVILGYREWVFIFY